MSQELTVVPHTGEVLDLPNETPLRLAEIVGEARELKSQLNELVSVITEEIVRRCDKSRAWTLDAGPYKITTTSDALKSVWDGHQLQEVLEILAAEGEITVDAIERAVTEEISYRVHASGVNALLKSPELAPKIEACRQLVAPVDRRLSISKRAS